ncbi:hypothetical protein QZJ86_20815 [Methylomonas montana]|uniref:hypothetical protein n=1 Tax=Methylomonas montana TaxID=3058963 RepID=UPI00265B695F|nr:hypothetical protein [Methylomonas montana]WKJ90420.1 hypothetical protein QZJ86_20815 [Methylomonas montana]
MLASDFHRVTQYCRLAGFLPRQLTLAIPNGNILGRKVFGFMPSIAAAPLALDMSPLHRF